MTGGKKRLSIIVFLLVVRIFLSHADPTVFLEFSDQPVRDILLCLGEYFEVSIVADESVYGRASFHLRQADIRSALDALLFPLKLYYRYKDGVFYISRLFIRCQNKRVTIHGEEIDFSRLIKTFSRETGHTVSAEGLPDKLITVHLESVTISEALTVLTSFLPGWHLDEREYYSCLYKRQEAGSFGPDKEVPFVISVSAEERISLQVYEAGLKQVLDALFTECGKEYVLFADPDRMLESLHYQEKSFSQLLDLVLINAEADFTVKDGLYFIYDKNKETHISDYQTVSVLPLKCLTAREAAKLVPADLLSAGTICFDEERNLVFLYGFPAELEDARRIISRIDESGTSCRTYRFDLKHIDAVDLISNLPSSYDAFVPQALTTDNAVLLTVPEDSLSTVAEMIHLIDTAPEVHPVRLQYIRADELIKQPPPSARSGELRAGLRSDLVFFTGGSEQYAVFNKEIALIDRPKPQIKYDILVIQYHESVRNEFNAALGVQPMQPGSATVFSAAAGGLLNLNFDIISAFGYRFAVTLNDSVSSSTAQILADTTLNGLCGNSIEFRNTDTYRYRDYELDTQSGQYRPGGIVREITSGLIIDLCGWISGTGMITMDISMLVSKRGADVSSQTGNPPPTSEKRITTQVRTRSGEPVVIGGLIQKNESKRLEQPGFIGDIPVIGPLLSSKSEYRENMEMAVYIVPHADPGPSGKNSVKEELLRLYRVFGGCCSD
jgi:type II secretory pathway component GspD/PulD (secretin)